MFKSPIQWAAVGFLVATILSGILALFHVIPAWIFFVLLGATVLGAIGIVYLIITILSNIS